MMLPSSLHGKVKIIVHLGPNTEAEWMDSILGSLVIYAWFVSEISNSRSQEVNQESGRTWKFMKFIEVEELFATAAHARKEPVNKLYRYIFFIIG